MQRQQKNGGPSFSFLAGAAALLAAMVVAACGGKHYTTETVRIPPRLDLHKFGRVALVQFTVEKAKGSLHELATERFAEEMFVAQETVEVLELRPEDIRDELAGASDVGPEAAREIGRVRHVPAVFAGHLTVSNVKPTGGGVTLFGLRNPFVEATVSVELAVRLLSTESGSTLWRASGAATEKVGQLGISGDDVFFSAKNPNDAYGRLVDHLVMTVTDDLRPKWQTERRARE